LAFAHHHQPAEAEIIVDARLPAAFRLMCLDVPPPLPPPPIQEHLDFLVPGKILL